MHWYHIFGRNEYSREFIFSCLGHDKLDYLSNVKYRDIVVGIGVIFREHDMGTGTATLFSDVEVGRVIMGIQDHISGLIDNVIIGISRIKVKQL